MTRSLKSIFNKNKLILFIDHEKIRIEIFKNKEKTDSLEIDEKGLDDGLLTEILAEHEFFPLTVFFYTFQCQYTHIPTQFIPFWHRLWIPFNLWRYYRQTVFGLKKKAGLVCGVHPQLNGLHQKVLSVIQSVVYSSISCRHWIMDSVSYINPIPEAWVIIPLVTPTGRHILLVLKDGLPIFSRVYNPDLLDEELEATTHYLKRYDFKSTDHAHVRSYDTPPLEKLEKSMILSIPFLWKKQGFYRVRQHLTFLMSGVSILTLVFSLFVGARGAWAAFKTQNLRQKTPVIDSSYATEDQLLLTCYEEHINKTLAYTPALVTLKNHLPKTTVITTVEWSQRDVILKMAIDPRVGDKNKLLQDLLSSVRDKLPKKMTASAQIEQDGAILMLSQ